MRIGDVQLFIVSDGVMRADAGAVFGLVPKALWEQVETADELNRVSSPLNCLLIVSGGKKILVDTGLGQKLSPKQERNFGRKGGSRLLDGLLRLGIRPGDIDLVINTHLHADHCGGNTCRVGDQIVATFPRAEYWVQKQEWADARYPNERTRGTYLAENFQHLERVRLLEGDAHVTEHVKCLVTRGHTRSHQSVLIDSGGEKAFYIGDMAGRAVYMEKLAWIPAYDVEPLETLETKRRIRDWALEENALLIFEHDPQIVCGRIKRDGEKWRIEKVDVL